MNNFLDGIEYRDVKPVLPTWGKPTEWEDWQDAAPNFIYAPNVQFRVKPKFHYEGTDTVSLSDKKIGTKDEVMSWVAQKIEDGRQVNVVKIVKPSMTTSQYLAARSIQFSVDGSEWRSVTYLNESGYSGRLRFRLRPDTYFKVRVSSGITVAELTFDDIEPMLQYVDTKSRTTESNITITREKYVR